MLAVAPKQAAHGLRKIAATCAAENGATEFELMAIFGWTDATMASHYAEPRTGGVWPLRR